MSAIFSRFQEPVYSLFRIVFGLLYACHGAQKLFGLFGGHQAGSPLMWAAGIIEFFGGVAIGLGLFTQIVAFICSGQMAVAYFMVHQPQGFLPIVNRGEAAVLYCFAFLLIMTRGSGKWALQQSGKL